VGDALNLGRGPPSAPVPRIGGCRAALHSSRGASRLGRAPPAGARFAGRGRTPRPVESTRPTRGAARRRPLPGTAARACPPAPSQPPTIACKAASARSTCTVVSRRRSGAVRSSCGVARSPSPAAPGRLSSGPLQP
jgi:hypothetical protein